MLENRIERNRLYPPARSDLHLYLITNIKERFKQNKQPYFSLLKVAFVSVYKCFAPYPQCARGCPLLLELDRKSSLRRRSLSRRSFPIMWRQLFERSTEVCIVVGQTPGFNASHFRNVHRRAYISDEHPPTFGPHPLLIRTSSNQTQRLSDPTSSSHNPHCIHTNAEIFKLHQQTNKATN